MDLTSPRYDGESLVNLSNSILKMFGAKERNAPLKNVELSGRKAIIILVDALGGWTGLERMSKVEDVRCSWIDPRK